jgi:hypothetical protein
MTLGAARARLVATLALGFGISVVLGAATFIARRTIEAPAARSTPPVLRTAAVFAPTLLQDVTRPEELDAITGPASNAVAQPAAPPARAHAPQPIPDELLLALGAPAAANETPAPTAAPVASDHAPAAASRPKAVAPAGPRLELVDQNLWGPSEEEKK